MWNLFGLAPDISATSLQCHSESLPQKEGLSARKKNQKFTCYRYLLPNAVVAYDFAIAPAGTLGVQIRISVVSRPWCAGDLSPIRFGDVSKKQKISAAGWGRVTCAKKSECNITRQCVTTKKIQQQVVNLSTRSDQNSDCDIFESTRHHWLNRIRYQTQCIQLRP